MSDAQLKTFEIKTIEVRYPKNDWLPVFKDSSLLHRTPGAGAGIHCEFFTFYLLTGPCIKVFDSEIETTVVAVQQLSICTPFLKN